MLAKLKKYFIFSLIGIALIFAVFHSPEVVEKDGKIHIDYWFITGQKETQPYQVKAFNASQDRIVVHATAIPWQEHEKKILTAVLSGNPPDVVSQFVPAVKWASRMALMPLDDYIERDAFDTTIFFPALWEEMKYQDHTFALPVFTVSYAFFYNKDIFREVGLDPDSPPETWDEVLSISKKMDRIDSSGRIQRMGFLPDYRAMQTNTLQTTILMAWQLGAEFLSADGQIVTLDNPETIKALQWVQDYYDQYDMDRIQAFRGSFGYADQNEFISGKIAMMVMDNSFPEQVAKYAPDLDYGIAVVPTFPGYPSASSSGSWWQAIPRGADQPEAAWEFMKYSTEKEMQLAICFNTEENLFPANRWAAADPAFNNSPEANIFVRQMDFAHSPAIVPMAHDVFWREMAQRVQERVVLHLMTPQESLREAQTIIQLELDKAMEYDQYVRSKIDIEGLR